MELGSLVGPTPGFCGVGPNQSHRGKTVVKQEFVPSSRSGARLKLPKVKAFLVSFSPFLEGSLGKNSPGFLGKVLGGLYPFFKRPRLTFSLKSLAEIPPFGKKLTPFFLVNPLAVFPRGLAEQKLCFRLTGRHSLVTGPFTINWGPRIYGSPKGLPWGESGFSL